MATAPTAAEDMCSVSDWVSTPATAPARVISRPSRIHAVPSAMISLVWNRVHGSRSSRAGIRLRTTAAPVSVFIDISAISCLGCCHTIHDPRLSVALSLRRAANSATG